MLKKIEDLKLMKTVQERSDSSDYWHTTMLALYKRDLATSQLSRDLARFEKG